MKNICFLVLVSVFLVGCGGPTQPVSQAPENARQETQPTASRPAINTDRLLEQAKRTLQKGDYMAAIKTLDAAIQRDREDMRSYLLLAETYTHLQRYDKAVDTLSAALAVAPNNGQVNYLLALNYHFRGEKEQAITYAQNSIKLFGQAKDEENFKKSIVLLQGLKSGSGPTTSN